MKKTIWLSIVITAVMLLIPISAVGTQTKADEAFAEIKSSSPEKVPQTVDTFRLYDHNTKEITEINREDYIFGVIAAEMPALYEEEALKAQSVAAYTYACYYRELNKNENYDLSTDPSVSQCYITKEEARKKWGDKADEYTEKLEKVIADTAGYTVKYDGKIILAVYHAIAAGKTEESGNVWGRSYPYLKSVDSSLDKESPNYTQTVSFSEAELKKLLNGVKFSGKCENYFTAPVKYPSGYVKEIKVCGTAVSGTNIRNCLDLRSACFDVVYENGMFKFTTYGYGHGVGLSQNGANALAKEGKDFKEILMHYYTGCQVVNN